jgi:hypothetical protein
MEIIDEDLVGNLLRTVEEKNDLLKYQVSGWSIWHYFRPAIGADLLFKSVPLPKKKEVAFHKRIELAIKGLIILFFPRKASFFVVTCSSDRSEIMNNKRKNIIFDNLLLESESYFIVESVNNPNFLFSTEDVLIKSDLTSEILLLIAYFLTKIFIPSSIKKMAEELSVIIRKEFGLSQYTPELVADWCMYFYWLKIFYKKLMKRVHPKIVLVGSGGASYIFAAAKELQLKIIEFQHGTLNHYNYVYSFGTYACKYKKQMPIPDYIFLGGEYGKKELADSGFWSEDELLPVGSIRIDEYRGKRENSHIIKPRKCTILLTTGTNSEVIVEFISKFLQLIRNEIDLLLIIKTHPAYETDGAPYLKAFGSDERVKVLLGNEQPSTFELLVQVDIHISVCSTCHYDSIALGTPTVILGLPTHEIFLPLHKDGHALLANTPEELFEIIRHFNTNTVPKEVSELYFKSGALENIKNALSKICQIPKNASR